MLQSRRLLLQPRKRVIPARVQGNSNPQFSATTRSSLAVTLSAVVPGNAVIGCVTWDNNSGQTLTSVTDDQGNSYEILLTGVHTGLGNGFAVFACPATSKSPTTITANWSALTAWCGIAAEEFSGVLLPDRAAIGSQYQASPGTGTDAVSSGVVKTADADLIYVASLGTTVNSAGTGFTQGLDIVTDAGHCWKTEYRSLSGPMSLAGTFTLASGSAALTLVACFTPRYGQR